MSEEQKPLDKMTVKDLRELAKEIPEITGASGMKKDALLAAIKDAKGIVEEAPAAPAPKKKSKGRKSKLVTIQDIKKEISKLQKKKDAADNKKEKDQIQILRKRISRLKKRTRKMSKVS